jgi:hypothetical protein
MTWARNKELENTRCYPLSWWKCEFHHDSRWVTKAGDWHQIREGLEWWVKEFRL